MRIFTWLILSVLLNVNSPAQEQRLRSDARAAVLRASDYFASEVALKGGYVYFYSPDLKQRFGEGVASQTQIWVQPPGTPTVGLALLKAYHATGEERLLKAATAAAQALIYGQLKSGGWTGSIDFNPKTAKSEYRNGLGHGRNFSTLDDGTSQAAIQLLMQVDQSHEFRRQEVRDAVSVALDTLLNAQFSTGGFPQGWDEASVEVQQPKAQGTYPDYDWRTEGRIKEYWDLYTLNDDAAGTIVDTLVMAHDVYESESGRFLEALRKLGDFLIASQMPEPQPAWAQQYNFQMIPVWARKFEPPAVAGRESQDVISALMKIYLATNDQTYLRPIPKALKYLKASALSDGRLARYYELRSNKPLYMNRNGKTYFLTYDDSNLPSHYGWKVRNNISLLEKQYSDLLDGRGTQESAPPASMEVRRIIDSLDSQGRWVSSFDGEQLIGQQKFRTGDRYLSSEVFSTNIRVLCEFLAPAAP